MVTLTASYRKRDPCAADVWKRGCIEDLRPMPSFENLTALPLLQNSWIDWSIALGLTALALVVLLGLRRTVRQKSQKMTATQQREILEIPFSVLSRTTLLSLLIVALFTGSRVLTLGVTTERGLRSALTIALFWQAGVWSVAAIGAWLDHKRQITLSLDRAAVGSLGIIGFVANVVVWALVVLLTLDNLGVDITALVAGLGIGGIAVALAVQNVLGDLFASLSITLDRPFVIGDFLIVGEFMGSVEHIGIKSTRLRSLSGEQIIISNSDLLGSRVRNYGRMQERRVLFGTSVTYETPIEQLERIPVLIRAIIEAQSNTRFDRCHFAKHAAASLDFETVYYVLSADYNVYMDIQQAINVRLHRELTELGVEFAYPTQKIYVVSTSASEAAPVPLAPTETQRRQKPSVAS